MTAQEFNCPDVPEMSGEILVDCIKPTFGSIFRSRGAQFSNENGIAVDLCSMTVNCILGHNDPWVKRAQIRYLESDQPSFHSTRFGSNIYYSVPARLVELNVSNVPEPRICHRQCNGSDAVELAIIAAHKQKGQKTLLLSICGSYHGQNWTAFSVSCQQEKNRFFQDADDVVFLGERTVEGEWFEESVLAQFRCYAKKAFAIIVEPIQVNNGVRRFSRKFFEQLREICSEFDVCLIFDEVQTCFGWLGTYSAAERYGIAPDISLMSKALTSGNGPLSIMVATERYSDLDYGTGEKTSGADVRSLVAANAVMDRLSGLHANRIPDDIPHDLRLSLEAGLFWRVPHLRFLLGSLLDALRADFPVDILDISGEGLIWSIAVSEGDLDSRRERAKSDMRIGNAQGSLCSCRRGQYPDQTSHCHQRKPDPPWIGDSQESHSIDGEEEKTMRIYREMEELFDSIFEAEGIWFSPQGSHRNELEHYYYLSDRDMETLFDQLPELNRYTRIASPGILKRFSVNGRHFVVKSVSAEDMGAQLNELKSGRAIFDTITQFAPSPITYFGFDLLITVPEAVLCTKSGRIMSVMELHPFRTLDEILLYVQKGEGKMR